MRIYDGYSYCVHSILALCSMFAANKANFVINFIINNSFDCGEGFW